MGLSHFRLDNATYLNMRSKNKLSESEKKCMADMLVCRNEIRILKTIHLPVLRKLRRENAYKQNSHHNLNNNQPQKTNQGNQYNPSANKCCFNFSLPDCCKRGNDKDNDENIRDKIKRSRYQQGADCSYNYRY
ncbi:MAG: hypothetical protein GY821_03665 [Gammaproteobacteria bacterium]|nr:hypothetical protein [Gammaproteobacteria bacterium]